MERMIELTEAELDAVVGGTTESSSFSVAISGPPGTGVGVGGTADLTSTPMLSTSSTTLFSFFSVPAA